MSVCDALESIERGAGNSASHIITDKSFPRAARLLSGKDYSHVFKQNKRYSDRYWTILARKNETGLSRLGLAIAKKRAKRAVDRNKIKRVAREAYRVQRDRLPGLELVVMNRDAATHASLKDLRVSIDRLFGKMSRATNPQATRVSSAGN